MNAIVTLTMSPSIDVNTGIDYVVPERKLRCGPPNYEPGGGGINVSRAIQKLGGESVALYASGGPTGQMLETLLTQEGLNHHPIPIKDWIRQNLIVMEESTNRQFRFGMPGPNFQEHEWRRFLEELSALDSRPTYIVASGSLSPGVPQDFYARLARLARELNTRLILDTSGEALHLALSEGVYLIKPNLRELGELKGIAPGAESEEKELAVEIVRSGQSEIVVVSLGAAGALLVSSDGAERIQSPTIPIRSKVGAGDSMVAGIVLSLKRGLSVQDAVRFGVAAGAAAVMTPGTELCRREDTERLYERLDSRGV